MNALHKMQDYLQQTIVISQRRSQKTYNEQATSRTNGNAADEAKEATATEARERQEEARHFYQQKMSRDRRSRDDLQRHHQRHSCKNEALEKYVKTVTMRADAFATTEADFFKALLDRQEEAQKHLNELSA